MPEKSNSGQGYQTNVEDKIINNYSHGCWARPAFIQEIEAKTQNAVLKWKCLVCDRYYSINLKTTGNIREHMKVYHKDLTQSLLTKKNKISAKIHKPQDFLQTHIDKKSKLVRFTQKGFMDRLVKYSVITDQSFLKVQHPAFVELLDYCHPGIELPNRKILKENIIQTFRLKKLELAADLQGVIKY